MIRAIDMLGTALAGFAVAVSMALAFGRPMAIAPLAGVAVVIAAARIGRHRPTLLSAAALADARFQWDDLLASAIATGADHEPFAIALRHAADVRCRAVRPSAVVVARRGIRGWTVISATTIAAILIPLGLNRPNPTRSGSADQTTAAALTSDPDPPAAIAQPPAAPTVSPRRTGSDDLAARGTPPADDSAPTRADGAPSHPRAAQRSAIAGTGRGSATSPRTGPTDLPTATLGTDPGATGNAIAGGGIAAPPPIAGPDGPAGTTAAAAPPSAHIPPWRSPNWPAARPNAEAGVGSGTVPPRDRDLVRAYFDRSGDPH